MAGTIKLFVSLRWIPSAGSEHPFPDDPAEQIIPTSGDNSLWHEQDLTTAAAALTLGSVATGGVIIAQNPNASNNVIFDGGTADQIIYIKPGETFAWRFDPAVTAPRAKMSASVGRVRYRIIDN